LQADGEIVLTPLNACVMVSPRNFYPLSRIDKLAHPGAFMRFIETIQ
jgi:hypothetical protein